MTRSEFLKLALATSVMPLGASLFARGARAQQGAADIAGKIVKLKGAASAMQDAMPRGLKVDDPVFRGDVLSTGRDARLEMKMLDDAVVTLGEKTVFVVLDYVAGGAKPNVAMRLIEGAFAAASGQIAKAPGGAMRIDTDTATIGIRGTAFWGGMLDGDFQIALLSAGRIVVENRAGRTELSRVGDGTLIKSADTAPTAPSAWGADKVNRAKATVAF
ncbi:MAG: FecR domain-containing protein [Rhodospirillales bacterium]|nr:FecR domain-containing protein [Rhodospirillales bacterium]